MARWWYSTYSISESERWGTVDTPGDYFSRKGFYCVNVQVIVDKKKRVLYRSIISRGAAEHDSTAFWNSSLYKDLCREQ